MSCPVAHCRLLAACLPSLHINQYSHCLPPQATGLASTRRWSDTTTPNTPTHTNTYTNTNPNTKGCNSLYLWLSLSIAPSLCLVICVYMRLDSSSTRVSLSKV